MSARLCQEILGIVVKVRPRTVSCVYEAGLGVNSQVDRVVRCRAASKDSEESSFVFRLVVEHLI